MMGVGWGQKQRLSLIFFLGGEVKSTKIENCLDGFFAPKHNPAPPPSVSCGGGVVSEVKIKSNFLRGEA